MIRRQFTAGVVVALFVAGVFGSAALTPLTVQAADCKNEASLVPGAKPWYSGLCKKDTNEIQINSSQPMESFTKIALNVLGAILILVGYVAVGFVIWGGFNYMMAAGDSGKISNAKSTIQNALIGLLIALSAAAIVTFIGGSYGIT